MELCEKQDVSNFEKDDKINLAADTHGTKELSELTTCKLDNKANRTLVKGEDFCILCINHNLIYIFLNIYLKFAIYTLLYLFD